MDDDLLILPVLPEATTEYEAPYASPNAVSDMPILYEDEGFEDMGDSAPHTDAIQILQIGIESHFAARPDIQVFSDLNLYYHPTDLKAYVSADLMVVAPFQPMPNASSYRIGKDGPAPLLTLEVLSPRTAQQRDLGDKADIYTRLNVAEYILVDPNHLYLERTLQHRKLQSNQAWLELCDPDGGVTSDLGFRIVIDDDGRLRVTDAATGHKYARPKEAEQIALALRKADERIRELEAENTRLRNRLGDGS